MEIVMGGWWPFRPPGVKCPVGPAALPEWGMPAPVVRRALGPGRVNLIGDHTDYNRGLALPMAVGLGVTVTFSPTGGRDLLVTSSAFAGSAVVPVPAGAAGGAGDGPDPATLEPAWARLVAAMAGLAPAPCGGTLHIESTLPVGSGLSSSAALSVALAEVFEAGGGPEEIARLGQRAEHAIGVPVGLMDPLVCAGGQAGHALLIDFDTLDRRPVPIPACFSCIGWAMTSRRPTSANSRPRRRAWRAPASSRYRSMRPGPKSIGSKRFARRTGIIATRSCR